MLRDHLRYWQWALLLLQGYDRVQGDDRVADRESFAEPHRYAEGISHVMVNGAVILDEGKMTRARPGRVLFGPATRR